MKRAHQIFSLFAAAYLISFFYRSANGIIAPDLIRDFGLDAAALGLMTGLFYAAFAAVQLPLGMALDRFGPRKVTPTLMLVAVGGSLLFATAVDFGQLAVGRALIGAGMAGVLMGGLKVFSRWFDAGRYGAVSGMMTGIGSVGAILATSPMAWVAGEIGWRGIFWIMAGLTTLMVLLLYAFVADAPPGSPPVTQSAVSPAAGLAQVFRDLRFWRMAPMIFFAHGAMLAIQGLWANQYLTDVLGLGSLERGNLLLLLSTGVTLGFLSSGWLAERLGLVQTVAMGQVVAIAAQLLMAWHILPGGAAPLLFLYGLTTGWSMLLLSEPRLLFPLAITGQATTAVNLFGIGGTFLIQWIMGLLIAAYVQTGAGHYPPAAYTTAFLFTGIGSALALVWYWPLRHAAHGAQE